MITISTKGSFAKTIAKLEKMKNGKVFDVLESAGREGVQALSNATPRDSGETAGSWTYEVKKTSSSITIVWKNTHMAGDKPLALMLQLGHGTGTGGYVSGRDYINPAMRPVFDHILERVRKAVTA